MIVCAIVYTDIVQEECALWLKNPEHKFKRNSEDSNGHRPFTMMLNCNFERVFEDKSKSTAKEDENTIHYYKFNRVMSNVFVITEVVYCILCMVIFLLIIYWNHE